MMNRNNPMGPRTVFSRSCASVLSTSSHSPALPLSRLYNGCMALSWPFLLFYYLLRIHTDGKYRDNFRQRLGLELPARAHGIHRVWFHALSVGETLSVVPLVKALKESLPQTEIVFSTATETGQAVARRRVAPWVDTFFYMPHDFPWIMDALVRRLQPALFLIVETDLWPNLLWSMKRHGARVVLVNGRLSQKSFNRMKHHEVLLGSFFDSVDLIFAQSSDDRTRYEALGVPADRLHAVGNLKFDSTLGRLPQSGLSDIRDATGIKEGRPVWIAGSTHEGEEDILLRTHLTLKKLRPELLMILAPRQIQRGAEIASLCERYGLSYAIRSKRESAESKSVCILDTLGELGSFYALADAAFIGGSLVPFGGHNPLEAVVQAKPTCWGPHLSNFREMEASLLRAGCCRVVSSEVELEEVMREWLIGAGTRDRTDPAAMRFLEEHSGCSRRIVQRLFPNLSD